MDHKKVSKLWDENASSWIEASEKGYDIWRDHFNTPAFLKVMPDVSGLSGLDIGFGDGYNTRLIAKKCKHLTAIDVSEAFFLHNKKNNTQQNISFEKMNAACMSFPNDHFDFVVSTMSMMDIADLDKVFTEIYRVLSPTGFLQFSIIHPCFNEHKGEWIKDKDGKFTGFLMKDYFEEAEGEIHEWQHAASPDDLGKFRVPRFSKPLTKWLSSLANAGFIIDGKYEPYADEEAIRLYPELSSTKIVAHSLIIRAKKNESYNDPWRKVIEKLPGNVWWKNNKLVYLGCNDRVIDVLGLSSRKEFIGKTDQDLWEKNIADKLTMADMHVLETGESISLEEVIVQKDGSHAIMLTNKSPLYDENGKITAIVGTSTDITDRKRMENKLAEALQAKGTFLSIVSHEIKGPLANVLYILGMLEQDILNDTFKKKTTLDLIAKEKEDANRAIDTITNLQKFLNLDLDKEELDNKKSVNVRSEVVKIIDDFEHDTDKNIGFNITDHDSPKSVTVNINIFKAIYVVVSNAFKYSRINSEILINIKNKIRDGKEYLEFTIKDTGVGIKKDVLKKLFIPLMNSYKNKEEISFSAPAVKLSYAKKIAELLDGNLKIKSEEGKGTEVIITVPYEHTLHVNPSLPVMDYSPLPEVKASKRTLKILSVEDNIVTSELLCSILKSIKQDTHAVYDSDDALKIGMEIAFDVIFMDISIPGIDGVELMKKIRKHDPKADKPIFIAITSHASEKDIEHFLQQGFTNVIKKPFAREEIVSCIESIQRVLTELGYP